MARITRRFFTTLPGAIAPLGLAVASPQSALAAAQADTAGSDSPDLLERRRQNVRRSSEELRAFDLAYTDEPLFRLVVR